MKTNKPNTTRVGLSLALLAVLAIVTVVGIRLQAADTTGDQTTPAGHCAMHAAKAHGASCHDAATAGKEEAAEPVAGASCHSAAPAADNATAGKSCCAPAAPKPMACCAMHGDHSDASAAPAAPHHH